MEHGIKVVEKVLFRRFDEDSTDRVAQCMSSNPVKVKFGMVVKFSEGKR